MATNPVDRFIGWLNPHAGLARHFARQRLQRAYEAASPRDTWKPRRSGASANADHQADASILRSKARALVQNVPYMRAGLDALVSYTVGTGILPRSTSATQGDVLNTLFALWAPVCDADGRLDFAGIEAAAYRAMEQDGEVLIRLRTRRDSDGLPVPLQLQLLEIDWLDTLRTTADGSSNQVVNGIEYDVLGRVVAYYLWDQHPGDTTLKRGLRLQSRRVPAASIIHLFAPERPGQGRGFTRFAPVIARVRDLQLYEDAELARKNQEARLSVLYSGDAAELENPASGSAANPGDVRTTGDLGELPSGSIIGVPAGGTMTVVEPKVAAGHVEYVKHQLHVIAAGIGVPYEMLTGDVREVNFSSARTRMLVFRTAVEQMRWVTLIPRLVAAVWRSFVDAAYLGGKIARTDYAVDYAAPKWDYVNPKDDAEADALEIANGLSTLSEKLRQRGYKPEDVFDEMQRDFDGLKARGLLDILCFLQKGSTIGQAEAVAGKQAEGAARGAPVTQVHNHLPAQTVNNTVPMPEQRIEHHTHVSAPEVHNRIENNLPAPEVHNHVEPTPVTVENRVEGGTVHVTNAVAPTPVHVENNVSVTTPPRKTEGTVERDAQGRLLRTTTIETDIR